MNGAAITTAKPFVKWVGGKGKLMPQLLPYIPVSFNDYYEPFLGGGAFYFSLSNIHQTAHLNDINSNLIDAYKHIRDDVDSVIEYLHHHHINFHRLENEKQKEYFLEKRDEFNNFTDSHPLKTALLIFLNKTCFNGLYRENRSGKFNVPFGKFSGQPTILHEENLRAVSEKLKHAKFYNGSYEEVLGSAREGDFIYLDPPYHPLNPTSNFTSYHSNDFNEADQIQLRNVYKDLDRRGCYVMLSNSASDFIKNIYGEFRQEEVLAARSINSRGAGRGKIKELIVLNY